MANLILVVENDKRTASVIQLYLEKNGYRVVIAYDGEIALELARENLPDLVVLDLMLPKLGGLEVCRFLRDELDTAIIMLTAKSTEEDKLNGLELGADDYLTKPFSPRELVARVRAVLRRIGSGEQKVSVYRAGNLKVDTKRHMVFLNEDPVKLTPKEFGLLKTLIREPGRVFSRLELLERVFGMEYEGLERTVDAHLMNLRRKLEANPALPLYIQTVYGVGYKFNEAISVREGNDQEEAKGHVLL